MARFWKQDQSCKVNPLIPSWIYFVEVCGFTFSFGSLEHIEEYLEHFSRKVHPSSADGAERRVNSWPLGGIYSVGDHWERQSRFDELPLYLFEEPKRLKVVKALQRALIEFT